jgi:hypothetical protein
MGDSLLLAELVKSLDNLQKLEFNFMGKDFTWYYKYLSLLEKTRIEQFCIQPLTTIDEDGKKTVKHERNKDLYDVHLIIEKALNEDGKKIFSHTNPNDIRTIQKFPYELAKVIADTLNPDIFGTMEQKEKEDEDE